MIIFITFLLGIANFALHRAVLDSGHAMVQSMTAEGSMFTPRVTLGVEFVFLLAAMLLVANGYPGIVLAYGLYSLGNGFAAWLVLTRKI